MPTYFVGQEIDSYENITPFSVKESTNWAVANYARGTIQIDGPDGAARGFLVDPSDGKKKGFLEVWSHFGLVVVSGGVGATTVCSWYNSAGIAVLRIIRVTDGNHRIQWWNGTGWINAGATFAFTFDQVNNYDVRCKISASAGIISVFVNNNQVVNVTNLNNTSMGNIASIELTNAYQAAGYWRDVFCASYNTLNHVVRRRYPTGSGTNAEWAGAWGDVDELATTSIYSADSDLITSGTVGEKKTFSGNSLTATSGLKVKTVAVTARHRFSDSPDIVARGSHSYWRVRVLANDGVSGLAISEIEMFSVPSGGTDLTTGGSAISSTESGGHLDDHAFDNNTTTYWQPSTDTGWVGYNFASPVNIKNISVRTVAALGATIAPKSFVVEYSDNGSTWTSAWSGYATGWTAGERKNFPDPQGGGQPQNVKAIVRLDGTDYEATGTIAESSLSYTGGCSLFEVDPATGAVWDFTRIGEFGIKSMDILANPTGAAYGLILLSMTGASFVAQRGSLSSGVVVSATISSTFTLPTISGTINKPVIVSNTTSATFSPLFQGTMSRDVIVGSTASGTATPPAIPGTISTGVVVSSTTVGANYIPESQTYFAAMTAQEPVSSKNAIDAFIRTQVANSIWSKLDWVLVSLGTEQASLVNMKSPSKAAVNVGSTTFTAYRGWTGGSGKYINMPEVMNAVGNNYSVNSSMMFAYVNQVFTGYSADFPLIGNAGSDNLSYIYRSNTVSPGTGMLYKVNAYANARSGVYTDGKAMYAATRVNSTTTRSFRNGTRISEDTGLNSIAVSTDTACLLRENTVYGLDRVMGGGYGGTLTDSEMTIFMNAYHAMATALGGNY